MANNILSRDEEPSYGKLTWTEEGTEGGTFHSRKLHVPPGASGATIGRGYDMKTKSSFQIRAHMTNIGLDVATVDKLVQLAGLVGTDAEKKIKELNLKDKDILDPKQQLELFKISYNQEYQEAARICSKPDVSKTYGDCSWSTMNTYLKEFIIDLKYQGLYTPEIRKIMQKGIVDRNYELLKQIVNDKLPSKYKKRNLQRIKLLKEAENYDKFIRLMPAQLSSNTKLA